MAEVNAAEVNAKAEAAFGAGFGDTPPAPAVKVVDEPVVEPAKPEPTVAAPVVVPEKPQYVRLTKQEWDNTKAAAGKVSSLESQVAKLMGSTPKAEQIVQQVIETVRSQTPAGMAVEMSDEDFAEMSADFPELTQSMRATLDRIFKKANVKGTGPAQTPAQAVDMDAAVEKVLATRELKTLEKAYPTWRETVGAVDTTAGEKPPEDNPFRQWLAAQPAEYQEEINGTNSAAELKAAIDKFVASQKAPNTATPAKPDKAAARRAVIEDAVTPRADGNPPPLNPPMSADDAFASGFKAVKAH